MKRISKKILRSSVVIVFLMFLPVAVLPQYFGRNKVQYKDFNWKYIQSSHFDIYYYDGGKGLAEFTAEVAESSYVSIVNDLRYEIEKRIPIIVYNSHNDFGQTNVTQYIMEESVEGFTESFKDRIVVQFRGSFKEFRHLIHHELTHAVMFQMFYGGRVGSMVVAMARFQLPLWLVEGLAEYESRGWDTESDMFMRDATFNENLPPISQLYSYMAYKGGQSVLHFISTRYGAPKIGELFNSIRMYRSLERGLKRSIGLDIEGLTKEWHKYLHRIYWPDIKNRDEPSDIAKRLTDHQKERIFLNNSPAISPKGDKLVYLTNRSDFIDIYLMDTFTGRNLKRLVKGERSDIFEELHWTRPGMDWSPDGKQICFAAKAGGRDALYTLDVKRAKVVGIYKFDLDGVFSPSWSPDGKTIVFMGLKAGRSDIYLVNLKNRELVRLTDDIFCDLDPVWSPTGDEIAFVSDRRDHCRKTGDDFKIFNHDYSQYDLYTLNVNTGDIVRRTFTEAVERSPAFSPDGEKIAFISDRNGINNIFIHDKSSGDEYPITNLLTGVSQISWSRDGSRLVFSSYYNGGYDIYLINNPLEIEPGSITLQLTEFVKSRKEKRVVLARSMEKVEKYKNYIFGEEFRRGKRKKTRATTFFDSSMFKDIKGEYKSNKYKLRFTPDLITGGTGYNQFYGLQGSSMLVLSDILGNHQINIYTDLFYNIKNSNFQFAYFYLPKRTDFGISFFHYSYLYFTYFMDQYGYLYWGYYRDRDYGVTLQLSHPFSKYRRLDFSVTGIGLQRDYGVVNEYLAYYYGQIKMEDVGNLYKRYILMLNLGYTTDATVWGMTGPVNGGRSNFSVSYSPMISREYGLDFWTVKGDWRRYFKIGRDFTFALRFAGGVSGGKNPQRFLLGGMMGWVNYGYNQIPENYWGSGDFFFFSSFATPLRGYYYYEMIGTRYILSNIEFRFPLIRYLILGWPLSFGFQNIRGVMFMDIGSAWEDDKSWRPIKAGVLKMPVLDDLRAGVGFGARMNLGFFLIKYDIGWGTNFDRTLKPVHYITLSAEW